MDQIYIGLRLALFGNHHLIYAQVTLQLECPRPTYCLLGVLAGLAGVAADLSLGLDMVGCGEGACQAVQLPLHPGVHLTERGS